MTPLFGQTLLLAALLLCAVGAPVGYMAGAWRSSAGLQWVRRMALGYAALMVMATLLMEYALVTHDFSVSYVASVGSRATPLHITIVSLWSSLEGSILFWGLLLAVFTAGVAILQRRGHEDYLAYTLGTLFAIGIFFGFLLAGPANPFRATLGGIPADGPGPNPLLQNHVLMIIHPPMLYLGYVGMSVPFAMAVAALLRGQLGPTWLLPLRNWLLVPVSFLSLGIMLGGWWSYEVLGWGGYWAWDPVENASFLPWLVGIAALHSAIVQQRRGTLKAWTTILIMIAFLLTILGTFLTRSGVVNSVHAFSLSAIGPLLLGFLTVCIVAVVVLLSLRIDTLASEPNNDALWSREGAFLLNNLLLVTLTFTVLIGTLFPIVAEAVRGVKVSVGEPFFNRMAVPIGFALVLLMGIGPALPWGRADRSTVLRAVLTPIPAGLVGLLLAATAGARSWSVLFTSAIAGYTLWVTFAQVGKPARQRVRRGEPVATAVASSMRRAPRVWGAYLSHLGIIITFVAIAISATLQHSQEGTLRPGGKLTIGEYDLTFEQVDRVQQPHLMSQRARVHVNHRGSYAGVLEPALNFYASRREPLGTPAVMRSVTHDLYLILMNVGGGGSVGLRAIVTPAVGWIWIGVFVLVAGTLVCFVPAGSPVPVRVARIVPSGDEEPAR